MTTHNLDAYERLAVRLASHPAEHQKIKAKLSLNRLKEPLFDTPGFVGHLEAAYQKFGAYFRRIRHRSNLKSLKISALNSAINTGNPELKTASEKEAFFICGCG